MDVQTGLIYVAVVVISALVIGFVSVFAMKEKSYEEAIAEQRKLPDDLLLGKKDKSKEKKHKNKMGKKVKEKKEDKEEKEEKPEHVQFEETPQILPSEPSLQENGKSGKKKGKAEKVKPILVNKDDPVAVINEPTPLQPAPSQESNHFDVTQPKDDLELIRNQSRENLHQISQSETAVNKSPKETPTKTKKNVKEKDSKKKDDHKEEKKETPSNGPQVNKENVKEVKDKPKESLKEQKEAKELKEAVKEIIVPLQSSVNKESKKIKKKKDNNIYHAQFGGDRDSVNFSCLDNLVQNAELSRSEIQILIEILLNKQQDSPQELAEWTKSRADPTIKLKKQLAETEKSLSIEREKNDSVQKKLAGLRTELNSDKQLHLRQLEEKVNEVQHLRTHIQSILDSHAIEKQETNRRIEELDAKIAEDAMVIQKLQEDQGQLQTLQQELDTLHKQSAIQLENENSLKIQLEEKHIELQQTCESSNRELEFLKAKVRKVESQLQDMRQRFEESTQTCSQLENKLSVAQHQEQELKDQLNYFQNEIKSAQVEASKVASLNEQLSNLQAELAKQKVELSASSIENTNAQLTELQSLLDKREQKLQQALSEINNLTAEITKARIELKLNQTELTKIQEDYRLSQKLLSGREQELKETVNCLAQTRTEIKKLKEQEGNKIVTARVEDVAELQKQIQQLREKNESLTSQLAIKERSAVDGRENGIEEKVQKNNIQIDESINLLAQKEDQLKSLRSQVESLRSQINHERSVSSRLEDDLEQQRSKNNDLRRKNWKVMEALNSAECRLKNNFGLNDDARKLKTEEQDTTKALLQRIFPEIKVTEKSHDQWIKVFEEQVQKTLNKLKTDTKAEDACSELEKTNKNLQAMVNHYKQIIDDTEGMLNKLQSHIESEEKRWQAQLRQKETEVSNLRVEIHSLQNKTTNNNNELQQKVAELESRLTEKESLKVGGIKSEAQLGRVESRLPDFSVVEKLQQENVRLSQQLQNEISKQTGLASQVAELRTLAVSTESSLTEEKRKNDLLQKEMTQLKSEVCGGSSSSDQSTLNGPPASDSPKSEPTLGTQCLIAALEQTLLKNSELENCSLTKPNNSAETPQDNDERSPTSKIASDFCNTTDKVLQNSCNPLNGQQHKKHKKKRKGGSGKK